ncbi:unnamed protein product [Amoebophrya sp. A120]|nr:unnamed protein product [Amoebophrya sp. A120]|eukprot:GSA120T00013866001.1
MTSSPPEVECCTTLRRAAIPYAQPNLVIRPTPLMPKKVPYVFATSRNIPLTKDELAKLPKLGSMQPAHPQRVDNTKPKTKQLAVVQEILAGREHHQSLSQAKKKEGGKEQQELGELLKKRDDTDLLLWSLDSSFVSDRSCGAWTADKMLMKVWRSKMLRNDASWDMLMLQGKNVGVDKVTPGCKRAALVAQRNKGQEREDQGRPLSGAKQATAPASAEAAASSTTMDENRTQIERLIYKPFTRTKRPVHYDENFKVPRCIHNQFKCYRCGL